MFPLFGYSSEDANMCTKTASGNRFNANAKPDAIREAIKPPCGQPFLCLLHIWGRRWYHVFLEATIQAALRLQIDVILRLNPNMKPSQNG